MTHRLRFYYESDGGSGRQGEHRSHYVIDRYAEPGGAQGRTDVASRSEGLTLARAWNQRPPWVPWDDIQATRDGYVMSAQCETTLTERS